MGWVALLSFMAFPCVRRWELLASHISFWFPCPGRQEHWGIMITPVNIIMPFSQPCCHWSYKYSHGSWLILRQADDMTGKPISCIRRQGGHDRGGHLPIVPLPGETDGELTSRHTMSSVRRKTNVVLFGLLFAIYCAGRKLHPHRAELLSSLVHTNNLKAYSILLCKQKWSMHMKREFVLSHNS